MVIYMWDRIINRVLVILICFIGILIIDQKDSSHFLSYTSLKNESRSHLNILKALNVYTSVFDDDSGVSKVNKDVLDYHDISSYKDGAIINLKQEAVLNLSSGVVVSKGKNNEFDRYVIIKNSDGIEYYYGNLIDLNVGLYDYVDVNEFIGISNNNNLILKIKDKDYIDVIGYLG